MKGQLAIDPMKHQSRAATQLAIDPMKGQLTAAFLSIGFVATLGTMTRRLANGRLGITLLGLNEAAAVPKLCSSVVGVFWAVGFRLPNEAAHMTVTNQREGKWSRYAILGVLLLKMGDLQL
ncbi:hypothetical protein BHE74_00012309 [Ensete ventricosum]|nr:hypothetical protein GW17_00054793 [Ensete ventricosum]RWW79406.1 hypothetical protein BHE74_00012309 [Ensete ventricosum]RZR92669.1 hypothetical protein BHM03_00021034 [Ensete ventricosum]